MDTLQHKYQEAHTLLSDALYLVQVHTEYTHTVLHTTKFNPSDQIPDLTTLQK